MIIFPNSFSPDSGGPSLQHAKSARVGSHNSAYIAFDFDPQVQ
jgi:hypothetical protein